MTSLVANLLLNTLLIGLLIATVCYCYLLNRRIQTLQNSKSEFASLLKHFDDSTIKASETIVAMQTASKKIGDNIQMRIEKANYLLDDLSYAIEKATRLSNQLDAGLAVSRARNKALQESSLAPEAASLRPESETKTTTAAMSVNNIKELHIAQEIAQTIDEYHESGATNSRQQIDRNHNHNHNHNKQSHKQSTKRNISSLEAMVEKVVSRKNQPADFEHKSSAMATAGNNSSSRSRAEQELIDLIRNSRG